MVERVTRSAAGSPLPRWSRRLLLLAAAGAGVWLLGCLGHQPNAQAETASARPVALPSVAAPSSSLVPPVKSAGRDPAERIPVAVVRATTRGGQVRDVPVLRPVARSVGGVLLPPVRSSETAVVPGLADRAAREIPNAHQPGVRPSLHRPAVPARSDGTIAEPDVLAGGPEPAPHPFPIPGIPVLPSGVAGSAPGSPHSLPLAEPVSGLASGPAAGLVAPRVVDAAGVRQRAYLPDTPPG